MSPLLNTGLDDAANGVRATVTHVGIATGNPGADGTANPSAAARKAVTWTAPATGGDFANTADLLFTGGAASGPAAYVTLWTALTGGTCKGYQAITGDTAFNAAGEFTILAGALTVAGSST